MTDIEHRLRHTLEREAARMQPWDAPAARRACAPASWHARAGPGRSRWAGRQAAVPQVAGPGRGRRGGDRRGRRAGAGRRGHREVRAGGRPAAIAGPAGAPRFYVSLTWLAGVAVVHDARTGQMLTSVPLPAAERGSGGPIPSVAAAGNDRTFAIAATERRSATQEDVPVCCCASAPAAVPHG